MKFLSNTISNSLPAFGLGLFALTTQIVLFRFVFEFFNGNELTIGISLAIWLSGSGLGSFVMPKLIKKFNWRPAFTLILVSIIIFSYLLAKFFPLLFNLKPGIFPTTLEATPIIFLTIFPSAVICGAFFPYIFLYFSGSSINSSSHNINSVYYRENLGAFIGGLTLNIFLLNILDDLQNLALAALIFLIFTQKIWKPIRKNLLIKSARISLYFLLLFLFGGSQYLSKAISNFRYSPYQLQSEKNTPYGNIKILEFHDQTLVLKQGKILYSIPDLFNAETHAFLPLIAHPDVKKILIIGGNLHDFMPYLVNFKTLKQVFYLEYDQYLIEFQKSRIKGKDLPFEVKFRQEDLREYLQNSSDKFDVICLNANEPVNIALNRFYTREFYSLIENSLNEDGYLFFSIQSSENYINPNLCGYINLLKNTLSTTFSHTFIIPGDNNYFYSSNSEYINRLPEILQARLKNDDFKTTYINPAYLKYTLSKERLSSFSEQLKTCRYTTINSDYNIRGYLSHFTLWNPVSGEVVYLIFQKLKKVKYVIISLLMISMIIMNVVVFRKKTERKLIWELMIAGGISISLEIIILLLYQIVYGSLYSGMAIIFGLYMLGLAGGSYYLRNKVKQPFWTSPRTFYLGFVIIAVLLYLPMFLNITLYQSMVLFRINQYFFLPTIIFLTGFITGGFFAFITHRYYTSGKQKMPGITYAADLIGAVPAALFISTFLIPAMGVPAAIAIIIGILFIQLF